MKLKESWEQLVSIPQTPQQQKVFFDEYFDTEKGIYEKILSDVKTVPEGTIAALAEKYEVEPVIFYGFVDGIESSLKNEIDTENLEEDSELKLEIDLEKLYFNMHDAKAKWLYTLPAWDELLTQERRSEIAQEWRASKQAVSEKTVGRNDPCPCGSGKKYKKCCGA